MMLSSARVTTKTAWKRGSTWLSNFTAVVLCLFLVAFFVVTVNNMISLSRQVNAINEGPYPVSVAAGRVETLLVQSQTLTERLTFVRTESAIRDVELSIDEIRRAIEPHLDFIAAYHTDGSGGLEGKDLKKDYERLFRLQSEYLALCKNAAIPDASIQSFLDSEINPSVDALLEQAVLILNESSAAVDNLYTSVTKTGRQTILLACILMAAVLVSLTVYLTLLRRKRLQEEQLQASLQRAVDEAQRANAAKSDFLSRVSHDIRTPLHAIMGLAAIADTQAGDAERVQDCLKRINISSKHLLGLINDVLDMSEIESGKMVLSESVFSLPALLEGIGAIAHEQARQKNLHLVLESGEVKHETVWGDESRLNQVLVNLVGNAVKYTPAGGTVSLAVHEEEIGGEARLYRFVIADTGIGMSQDFTDRMFEPFERERTAATTHIEGSGLGLAIAHSIVSLMGGTLDIRSSKNSGTCVTAAIPLRPVLSEQEPTGEHAPAQEENPRMHGNVLLVEDNDLNREIARAILEDTGVSVREARNGKEALDMLDMLDTEGERAYSLVFMDIQMPVMDGIEATERIRRREEENGWSPVPIVAMTANAFSADRERALEAGMNDFLTKPLDLAKLHRVLRQYCA